MAITSFLSVPTTPHQTLFSQQRLYHYNYYTNTITNTTYATLSKIRYSCYKSINLICSSSSVVEEVGPTSTSPFDVNADDFPAGGCKACGRQEIERGCNGEGRIQGGIATVPGFGWWPIKAFRPCPGYLASGGRYRRRGQTMDDVVSGGGNPTP